MTITDAIQTFRAVRRFTEAPLQDDTVRAILNAGRRAQSSKNTQAWLFIAVRNRDTLQQLAGCGPYARHLAGAALGVALVAPAENPFDLGQAAAYMMLRAWELGVGSCIASMYDQDKARAVLGVPEDHVFRTAISFGYPLPGEQRPPGLVPGGRRPFDEVVRWEHF
ncbi:MAG TPA: nitroreductase family protein [Chloroflexia bacterium]|nr:nitroreductase family protein [Chloroflexia bacterium]